MLIEVTPRSNMDHKKIDLNIGNLSDLMQGQIQPCLVPSTTLKSLMSIKQYSTNPLKALKWNNYRGN